jgi:hypothetical protein
MKRLSVAWFPRPGIRPPPGNCDHNAGAGADGWLLVVAISEARTPSGVSDTEAEISATARCAAAFLCDTGL